MKTIFLSLILMLVAVSVATTTAQAQRDQTIRVRVNQQKSIPRANLTITFLSLVEDSRCPEGTRCVWAGNARILVRVSHARGGKPETFEINTNTGARGASFDGYAINLVSLEPRPRANARLNRNAYTATFDIVRLRR